MEIEEGRRGRVSVSDVTNNPSAAYLIWEDLTAVLLSYGGSKSPRKILQGISGYAVPGRIMAIMGPSGSGKSTLLDSLSGRLGSNLMLSGRVILNGRKRKLEFGDVAYVTQENVLLGTLTVREAITYSAFLRLPTTMSKEEVRIVVENTIEEMGLHDCSDSTIGNWHLRGISGGEKKRLSIALEILSRPRLLLLDEPTSGLDSASAFFVIQTLRQMVVDGNKTIISSIHQPSSEVFALFDDLCLLSGGEVVYFGDAIAAPKFFKEVGFPCPSRRNPSDHFLRCINSDFDQVTATLEESMKLRTEAEYSSNPLSKLRTSEIRERLIDKYRSSQYALITRDNIQEISKIEGLTAESEKRSHSSWFKQLRTLTKRSFTNMSRDFGYYWLRIIMYILVSFCVGSIYYDVGTSYTAILARSACSSFVNGFMAFMSIGGFLCFIEEMKVFTRERLNGHYGVVVYILSNFMSSFPFLLSISIITSSIVYPMVKFHKGFEHFAYFTVSLYAGISVIESLMMVIAAVVPNFLMGVITGVGILGIMATVSGFFQLLPDLPMFFWRYPLSYMAYGSWALQGGLKNDFLGLEFDPMIPGQPKISGEYAIKKMLGVQLDHSKWLDLGIIFVILFGHRLAFFLVLKFKESASPILQPILRTICARVTIWRVMNRPSLKKRRTSMSKRHQPPHSMAVQEGLSSPLPC